MQLFAVTHDGVTLGTIAVGKTCYLNGTEFCENGKGMVDAVWLEDASGRIVAEATIIKYDAAGTSSATSATDVQAGGSGRE